MAPSQMLESAKNGTYLAPVANIIVSSLFVVFGCYALSAAGVICRLPLLKLGSYCIITICIVRGILPLQFWLSHPAEVNNFVFYSGIVWLVTGCLYLFGYRVCNNDRSKI